MNTLQIKEEVNVETASMIQDLSDWFVSRCLFHKSVNCVYSSLSILCQLLEQLRLPFAVPACC